MTRNLIHLLMFTMLLAPSWAHPNHEDEPSEWLPKAELQQLFPKATDFTPKRISNLAQFDTNVQKKLNKRLSNDELAAPMFTAFDGSKPIGYARAGIGKFKAGTTLVLVGVDTRDRVIGVLVADSKLAVARPAFLNQFKGKRANDAFAVGKDVKATSGPAGDPAELARVVREGAVLLSQARLD